MEIEDYELAHPYILKWQRKYLESSPKDQMEMDAYLSERYGITFRDAPGYIMCDLDNKKE